jgi:hypothetical protein
LTVGTFIGTGGMNMTPVHVWNLGYRLSPMSWGRGFASEIALQRVWEGPTSAAVVPGVHREVFSDRELTDDALQWLVDNA